MRINHNIAALNTHRQLNSAAAGQSKSMEKLASGLRINRAGDDAAGLAISEKMRAQVRGLDQASKNAQDGISMIQTAEGALNETHSILQRMRELATQASNDTNVTVDRGEIQKEINQLSSEINRIGNTTEFNTQSLLKGDGKANLKETGLTATTTTAGATTNTPASQAVTFGTLVTGDNGKSATFTLNGQAIKVNLVEDTANVTATKAVVDTDNATANEVTIKYSGTVAAGDVSAAFKDALNAAIGKNDALVGNFSANATGATLTTSATTTGNANGAAGSIAAVSYSAALATAAVGAASVGTTVHTQEVQTIDFASLDTAGMTAANNAATDKAITDLVGKGMTIAGQQIEFYNSNDGAYTGNAIGVNISTALATTETANLDKVNELVKNIATQLSSKVPGVTISQDTTTKTKLNITDATYTGEAGKGKIDITDGGVQEKFEATFQVGANKGQSMTISIEDMRSSALGITGKAGDAGFTSQNVVTDGTNNNVKESALDVSNHTKASSAIKVINDAIEKVSAQRSNLGAFQNRLEHTINNLGTSSENLTAAESRIRDVDMAKEMMEQTKNSILSQAAQAMLAQANQQPQGVLQLLR